MGVESLGKLPNHWVLEYHDCIKKNTFVLGMCSLNEPL